MMDVSGGQDDFPTNGISLSESGNLSDSQDMRVKLKEVLTRELKSRNESVHAVAEATGIPSSTLHAWSTGQLPSAKNLHLLKKLSDYLNIPLSVLLFNAREGEPDSAILFSSEFVDDQRRYRLIIEKLPK